MQGIILQRCLWSRLYLIAYNSTFHFYLCNLFPSHYFYHKILVKVSHCLCSCPFILHIPTPAKVFLNPNVEVKKYKQYKTISLPTWPNQIYWCSLHICSIRHFFFFKFEGMERLKGVCGVYVGVGCPQKEWTLFISSTHWLPFYTVAEIPKLLIID